jgi:hypothetical protein
LTSGVASGTVGHTGISAALSGHGKDDSRRSSGDTLSQDELGRRVEESASVGISLLDQELESNTSSSSSRGAPVELGEEGLDTSGRVCQSSLAVVTGDPGRGIELGVRLFPVTNTAGVVRGGACVAKKAAELEVVVQDTKVEHHQFAGLVARHIAADGTIARSEGVGSGARSIRGASIQGAGKLGAKGPGHDTRCRFGTIETRNSTSSAGTPQAVGLTSVVDGVSANNNVALGRNALRNGRNGTEQGKEGKQAFHFRVVAGLG